LKSQTLEARFDVFREKFSKGGSTMRKGALLIVALGFVLLWTGQSLAEFIYASPLPAVVESNSVLSVEPDCCPSTSLEVTASEVVAEGDFEWVIIPLTVLDEDFRQVRICYEVDTPSPGRTYISQVRLTRMNFPDSALVLHDDPANLVSDAPTCYNSRISPLFEANGTITLGLKMVFGSASDRIKIGAIRLFY
jgi:hypothetical protein